MPRDVVLQTPDVDAPAGISFRVSAKDIRTGRVLAQFVTSGTPPQRKARWVAGPNGFVRETLAGPSLGGVARQLCGETLDALGRALSRR